MLRIPVAFGYILQVEWLPVPVIPTLLLSTLLGILVFQLTGAILVFLPLTFRVKM